MSNDVSTLEHVYQHEAAVAAALTHNPFVGAPAADPIPTTTNGIPADAHGQSNDTNENSKVGDALDKAAASLPSSGHPPKEMSHAGLAPGGKVRLTSYPSIANAPLPAEGNGSFNNIHLGLLVFFAPAVLLRLIPFVKASWFGWISYIFLVLITGVPVTVAYWTVMSRYGPRKNEKIQLPGKSIETYLTFNDAHLREKYSKTKIPMEIFYENYFDGKIDIKGDMLDVLEHRLDWSLMHMTPELFKFVLTVLVPDVLTHSAKADEDMIRDHYDRGNDFYEWFLGPQMIYTSGMISDATKKETLEELQNNKLSTVCSKLGLRPGEKLLDIGCGWGTLTAFAAKNYGVDATGVTLARNQTKFGNERIAKNGLTKEQARILCMDYRYIPVEKGHYDKIVSLEMAEHVGIRHYSKFLSDVYERLDDDGTFLLQVAGLRPCWQYWDLIWGIFMNKYIFRGADASCSLGWVINKLESAGFEIRSADVIGVHYSATIEKWFENWKKNEIKIKEKYGNRLYKIWLFFLASSTIVAREGGSSAFQIVAHKNLNAFPRIEGTFYHNGIHPKLAKNVESVYDKGDAIF